MPILRALEAAGLGAGPPSPADSPDGDEFLRRLGTVPFVHQPGEVWMYHTGAAVLGVLIARVAGSSFGAFLAARVFGPLGMTDTGFHVPAADIGRLPTLYCTDAGAGGLFQGERLLSRPAVDVMTTDQITPEQKAVSPDLGDFWSANGWGFGMSVVTRRTDVSMVPGRVGWDGGLGTAWSVDRGEKIVTILMTQKAWSSPDPPAIVRDFRNAAYAAIDD